VQSLWPEAPSSGEEVSIKVRDELGIEHEFEVKLVLTNEPVPSISGSADVQKWLRECAKLIEESFNADQPSASTPLDGE
jgi:hypothetical protein